MVRFRFFSLACALLILGACAAQPASNVRPAGSARFAPMPDLIPLPARIVAASGEFTLPADAGLRVDATDPAAANIASHFVDLLRHTRGIDLQRSDAVAGGHAAIVFLLDQADRTLPAGEGYRLTVNHQGIRVAARDPQGLFYGSMTLWELLTPPEEKSGQPRLADMTIDDQPRFRWRGLMLDSARHMQSVADIETLLQQMAQHKLNVFHWHLTDDQGWRIQIKRYPKLTSIGAWRTPPDAGHDGEPKRYGGFYTQEQIRQVVAYAAARYITVVPEIDMPGHAQAAVASYPRLGVTGKRPQVSVDWGINPYLYNVDDATFTFIDNVLDEVMALFPSKYIHVGGDEAIKDQWLASPAVQARMRALGLKDPDALQGWFIDRVGTYLAAHGRRLIGWDEILAGGPLPPGAAVMSWRGTDGAIKAVKSGHDVVLSPSSLLYLDGVQSDRVDDYAGRLPVHDLASVYAFEPVPAGLDAEQASHVLGAQANLWTEHMPGMAHVEHAVFPRLDALSEVDWSPAAARNWPSFLQRLPAQFARYRAQGIGYADDAFAADIEVDRLAALSASTATVTLDNQVHHGELRYTVDGSTPGPQSPLYRGPFKVSMPATVRAATFVGDGFELAAPRQRVISRPALLSVSGVSMPNCPRSAFRLRAQPMPDALSVQPVYAINVFNSCQMFPPTPLDGIGAIHVDAVRLVRNYALAHEQKLVVEHARRTRFGELVVHQDSCDGAVLASLPLPDPRGVPGRFSLDGSMLPARGTHGLCLQFTASGDGPLYALGQVALQPAAPRR